MKIHWGTRLVIVFGLFVAALLAAVGSVLGLTIGGIYAQLTPVFLPQALAQDLANLLLVAPAWLILATLAENAARAVTNT